MKSDMLMAASVVFGWISGFLLAAFLFNWGM